MDQPDEERNNEQRLDNIQRPFTFDLEAWVARGFINACRARGLFVRNTLKGIMIDFIKSSKTTVEEGEGNVKADVHRARNTRHRG